MEPLSRTREKFSNTTTKKGRSHQLRPILSLYFNTNRFCAPSIKFIVFVFRRTAAPPRVRTANGPKRKHRGFTVTANIFLSMARNGNHIKICIKTKFCNDIRQSRNAKLIVFHFNNYFFDFFFKFQHGVCTKYYCGNMHC